MNSSSVPASADAARARPAASTWALQHRARRLARPARCRRARTGRTGPWPSTGLPGRAPQGVEVEVEHHVAVAALPGADRVAVDGVHVDVDGEQVVAPLGAVLEHRVEEELAVDPLALQASLHVGEGDDDGVDRRRRRCPRAARSTRQCGWCASWSSLSWSCPQPSSPRSRADGRVAVLLHGRPGRGRRRRRGRPRRSASCWSLECSMLRGSTGIAVSSSCSAGLGAGHGLDQHRRAGQRRDRQVQPRVGHPVRRRGRRPRSTSAGTLDEPGPLVRRRAARSAASAAAPGSTTRRKSSASAQRRHRLRDARRLSAPGLAPAYVTTTVPPPRPRRVVHQPRRRAARRSPRAACCG